MQRSDLIALLTELRDNQRTPEEVAERLATLPFENLGFANIDHHRSLRTGLPEVVYAAGKTPEQTAQILARLHASGVPALATRASAEAFAAAQLLVPSAEYHASPRAITIAAPNPQEPRGHVVVLCAGTSDLPVADEAALTARFFGARVTQLNDVGVAGLHRLLAHLDTVRSADAVIAVAGMEGALASVAGGLVAVPVIAVPTTVGYGAAFGGITTLAAMLTSCTPNTTVVNLDNGFGAGYTAALIASRPKAV